MLQEGDASFPSATEPGGQPSEHPKQAVRDMSATLSCPLHLTGLWTLRKHYKKAGGKVAFFLPSLLSCSPLRPREGWSCTVCAPTLPVPHPTGQIWNGSRWTERFLLSLSEHRTRVMHIHMNECMAVSWNFFGEGIVKHMVDMGNNKLSALPVGKGRLLSPPLGPRWGRIMWPSAARMQAEVVQFMVWGGPLWTWGRIKYGIQQQTHQLPIPHPCSQHSPDPSSQRTGSPAGLMLDSPHTSILHHPPPTPLFFFSFFPVPQTQLWSFRGFITHFQGPQEPS